jgi:pimeloyl-ACP methyl ester carboxylesterase
MRDRPNVVLVHGAWSDASVWTSVVDVLEARGCHVTAPQFLEAPLGRDVTRLRRIVARQDGPTIVVGHCFGAQIVTAMGSDAGNVAALVYVAALALDEGETIGAVLGAAVPTRALARLIVDEQSLAWLPEEDFAKFFATDVAPERARAMHARQRPLPVRSLDDAMGFPAWRSVPSWYLVASDDQTIPPDLQRRFAQRMAAHTFELACSHVPMVSHPAEVADLIEAAAVATRGRPWAGRARSRRR